MLVWASGKRALLQQQHAPERQAAAQHSMQGQGLGRERTYEQSHTHMGAAGYVALTGLNRMHPIAVLVRWMVLNAMHPSVAAAELLARACYRIHNCTRQTQLC